MIHLRKPSGYEERENTSAAELEHQRVMVAWAFILIAVVANIAIIVLTLRMVVVP